jgi:hypothetical protein
MYFQWLWMMDHVVMMGKIRTKMDEIIRGCCSWAYFQFDIPHIIILNKLINQ